MSKIFKMLVLTLLLILICPVYTYAKELQQQINIENVETDKSWRIKFNIAVDIATLGGNINITDSKGNTIDMLVNVSDDKKAVTLTPKKAYVPNEIYSLNVNKNIKPVKGKALTESLIKKFSVTEYKI